MFLSEIVSVDRPITFPLWIRLGLAMETLRPLVLGEAMSRVDSELKALRQDIKCRLEKTCEGVK